MIARALLLVVVIASAALVAVVAASCSSTLLPPHDCLVFSATGERRTVLPIPCPEPHR